MRLFRKSSLYVLLFCVITQYSMSESHNYTNDGGKGKSISFTTPVIKNSKASKNALAEIIRNNLERVWIMNSAFTVVATDKMKDMIETQRKSQDSRHSDETAIQAGDFIAELFSAYTTITISASGQYTATIRITDNRTSEVPVNWDTPVYDTEEEFISYAANDIALYALPLLGVELSSFAKTKLSYRENTGNESLADTKRHFESLTVSINEIDAKLSEITKSKMEDSNAIAEKTELELSRKQLILQQQEAEARIKRLEEDEERIAADKQRASSRSEALNKKIASQGVMYDTLAAKKRKEYEKDLNADASLRIVERKKQSMYDLRSSTVEKIKAYYLQEDADCEKKVAQIENEPYSTVEKDQKGKITRLAKKERKTKIKAVQEESHARKQSYLQAQFDILYPAYETIRTEANGDSAKLKEQKDSSLVNNNILRFGNYDGSKKAWVAYVDLILANEHISSEKILIPYKNITGLTGTYKTDAEKIAYNETVEEYNSYFANNIPVIYVEVHYEIYPNSAKYPSQYSITITSYVFKKIETDEVIYTVHAKSGTKTLTITPAVNVDSRTELTLNSIESEIDSDMQAMKKAAQKQRGTSSKWSAGSGAGASKLSFTFGDILKKGYIPIGIEFGALIGKKADTAFGINAAYLFYIPYIDVGPEIKLSFSRQQFDFKIAAKVQKTILYDFYVAGDAGLHFFSVKPAAAFFAGAEIGYRIFNTWSLSFKWDVNTQPKHHLMFCGNYYFQ
ncbi:MAG: hypothetical protein ACTTH7_06225 [Treponema sp.]